MSVGLPWVLSALTAGGLVSLEPRVWGRGRQGEQQREGDEISLGRRWIPPLGSLSFVLCNTEPLKAPEDVCQMVHPQVATQMACCLPSPKDTPHPGTSPALLFHSWPTLVIPKPELRVLSPVTVPTIVPKSHLPATALGSSPDLGPGSPTT